MEGSTSSRREERGGEGIGSSRSEEGGEAGVELPP